MSSGESPACLPDLLVGLASWLVFATGALVVGFFSSGHPDTARATSSSADTMGTEEKRTNACRVASRGVSWPLADSWVYTGDVPRQRTMLRINMALALLFVVGAGLQLNDPDPLRWIAMYLAAAGSSALWGRWPRSWLLSGLVALMALAWALYIAANMAEWVSPEQMFEPMQSRGGAVEQSRELYGLGMIGGWMGVLLILGRKQRVS